jgi:hypothetical protein
MLLAHGKKVDDTGKRVGSQSAAYMNHRSVDERRDVLARWARFVVGPGTVTNPP